MRFARFFFCLCVSAVIHPQVLAANCQSLSSSLCIERISQHVFLHTSENNNGIAIVSNGEALIVSTPASADDTKALLDWITFDKRVRLLAVVADRWHPDAMGGLDMVHNSGVTSIAHNLTRRIASERGLPIARIGFDRSLQIQVGRQSVVLDYLGQAHTSDGIVAWVPEDKVLFGGNSIRNAGGWVGNIGDANLEAWANTIRNMKDQYGRAQLVVPGHGKLGDAGLLDYTIALYDQFSGTEKKYMTLAPEICFFEEPFFFEFSETEVENQNSIELKNTSLIIIDKFKAIRVVSPHIIFEKSKARITSSTGAVQIYDKEDGACVLRSASVFSRLTVLEVDEYVGFAVVVESARPLSKSSDFILPGH